MSMPNGFLALACLVDALKRHGDFNEFHDCLAQYPDIIFEDQPSKGFGLSSLENQAGYDEAGLPCAILLSPA